MKTPTHQIRAAEASDQASIRALIRRVRINPLNLDWQNFHVAVDRNDLMIGCGQIKTHRDGTQELASIAVEVEWRGRGIGADIILSLLDTVDTPLWLVCRSEMGAYYEKFRFRIVEDMDKLPRAYRRMRSMSRLVSRVFPNADDFHIMILDYVR
jgi:N-acetylglutamate synthase-like GNAT family acetyltransferase